MRPKPLLTDADGMSLANLRYYTDQLDEKQLQVVVSINKDGITVGGSNILLWSDIDRHREVLKNG